jgi:hypothetical protein
MSSPVLLSTHIYWKAGEGHEQEQTQLAILDLCKEALGWDVAYEDVEVGASPGRRSAICWVDHQLLPSPLCSCPLVGDTGCGQWQQLVECDMPNQLCGRMVPRDWSATPSWPGPCRPLNLAGVYPLLLYSLRITTSRHI